MRRRPGAASAGRPFALGGCLSGGLGTRNHHNTLGCLHPLPSLFLCPRHTGPSPGAAGHRMEGWESPRLFVSKPAHGTCSGIPFSGPAFVGAKYSHILAARQGKTGDCTGCPARRSSSDGSVYRDVVSYEAELVPCLFSASSWRALGAQERSCEDRSHVPGWGDSGAWPRAHLMRLHVSFDPRTCLAPWPCWLLSHTTSHLPSPALTPLGRAPASARGKRWCFVPQLAPVQRLIVHTQDPFSMGRGG